MMLHNLNKGALARVGRFSLAIVLVFMVSDATGIAQRRRGHVRGGARRSVYDRDHRFDRHAGRQWRGDRYIDFDRDFYRDYDRDLYRRRYGCCYNDGWESVAAAAVGALAGAAVGSAVHNVPASCETEIVNGLTYLRCGSVWYLPEISGSSTRYVVVNPPY